MRLPLIAGLLLLLASGARAQAPKPLRWACDPAGGAPFIIQLPDGSWTGFEVELAEYLGKALGRPAVMVTGDWPNLPQALDRPADAENGIDIILNGYELQPDLAKLYRPSRPYYVYRITLMARADDDLRGWADLFRPRPDGHRRTVGVLGGTSCANYVEANFDATVDLSTSTDVANVIELVANGRFDATVQDSPAATHFLKEHTNLRAVGEPVQPNFYVVYTRKTDDLNPGLGDQIDAAITAGVRDGTLQRIYEKYDLWNEDQERLSYWADRPWPPPVKLATKGADGEAVNPWPRLVRDLLRAALVTVELAVLSFPLAMAIGLAVAVGRVYGPRWLGAPLGVYVEVVRGTPLLLQLFMLFYLVPKLLDATEVEWLAALGKAMTPMAAGVFGLAINYSAYEAENYRAGLEAIPRGQMEAAESLGMTRLTAIRRIVAPQAVRLVIPPVTNDFIALFKDTSACSIILVVELTRKYNELFNMNRGLIVELAFLTAGLYLLMSYPLALLAQALERRLGAAPGGKP